MNYRTSINANVSPDQVAAAIILQNNFHGEKVLSSCFFCGAYEVVDGTL